MASSEDINDTELENYIIQEHEVYLSDLVSKNNKWMNILLSSTGLNQTVEGVKM